MRTANVLMGVGALAGSIACGSLAVAATGLLAGLVFAALTVVGGLTAGNHLARAAFGRARDQ